MTTQTLLNEFFQEKLNGFSELATSLKGAKKNILENSFTQYINDAQLEFTDLLAKFNQEKKEKKEKKDPNAPKRTKSSYLFFCAEKRSEVKESNPNMGPMDVTRELGKLWRELSDEDKEQYKELSVSDNERYLSEKNNYSSSSESNKDVPKRSKSAYLFFCAEKRPEVKESNPNMGPMDVTRELGRLWKELSDEEKIPFQELAKESKEKKQENDNEEKSKEKKKKSPSAFILFSKDNRANIKSENPDASFGQIAKIIGDLWNSQDDSVKAKYTKMSNGTN
jgi:hypothetical protein